MGLGQVKFWNPYINCKGSCEGTKKIPDFVFQALFASEGEKDK